MRRLSSLAAVVVLTGCGGPPMGQVSGRITCQGKRLWPATITFSPVPENAEAVEGGKPADGVTDENGNYDLTSYSPGDGVAVNSRTRSLSYNGSGVRIPPEDSTADVFRQLVVQGTPE